jgi:hypothetical protein
MKMPETDSQLENIAQTHLDRRNFFRKAGYFGLGAAVTGLALGSKSAVAQANSAQVADSTAEILTAFLIAEDLATTFYYNGLVGAVIQDPNLAGPGGNANHVTSAGNFGNVDYLRAAFTQEFLHANLFRNLLTGSQSSPTADPYQTFYFPTGTFDTLDSFLGILNALENAFIGAYLTVIQEFSYKATLAATGGLKGGDTKYSAQQYELMAKRAASIMGVECEHRVLGRVIGNDNPANNLTYESTDGLTSIYNGSASAVVALTPFLTPSTGPGYSLATALYNQRNIGVPSSGGLINS